MRDELRRTPTMWWEASDDTIFPNAGECSDSLSCRTGICEKLASQMAKDAQAQEDGKTDPVTRQPYANVTIPRYTGKGVSPYPPTSSGGTTEHPRNGTQGARCAWACTVTSAICTQLGKSK